MAIEVAQTRAPDEGSPIPHQTACVNSENPPTSGRSTPSTRGHENARPILRHYALKQSKEGFRLLAETYFEAIKRVVARRLRNRRNRRHVTQDVEDATQIAFIRLHKSLEKHPAPEEIENLEGWMYKIIRRAVSDYERREKVRAVPGKTVDAEPRVGDTYTPPTRDRSPDVFDRASRRECLRDFARCLEGLNERNRQILWLWVQGHRLRDIAEITGLTINGVAAAKIRGLAQVQKHLKRRGWDPVELCSGSNPPQGNRAGHSPS